MVILIARNHLPKKGPNLHLPPFLNQSLHPQRGHASALAYALVTSGTKIGGSTTKMAFQSSVTPTSRFCIGTVFVCFTAKLKVQFKQGTQISMKLAFPARKGIFTRLQVSEAMPKSFTPQ